jgi:hypothetical protein
MNAIEQQLAEKQAKTVPQDFMGIKILVKLVTPAEMHANTKKLLEIADDDIGAQAGIWAPFFMDPATGQPAFGPEFIRDTMNFAAFRKLIDLFREVNGGGRTPNA